MVTFEFYRYDMAGLVQISLAGIAVMKAPKDRPGCDAADWVCFGLIVVVGDLLTHSLMRPFLIEVNGKFLDHSPQMLTMKNENVVQAFSFQAAHEPFAYAIGLHRQLHPY